MRAAIYSRKSIFTGKGESIENQIQLCIDYGNRLGVTEYFIYEDEGYSGGNTNRPKFQQLLKDLKIKAIDVLICYRLDRISRNVADFSNTLEFLQKNNISFVSIREQFDTSTPMGRAMVYIASVFAQLERETIAERVRDNMLQLAKTGRWLGGQEPFGFKADRVTYMDEEFRERSLMQLTPLDEELIIVKLIYSQYLEFLSITKVVNYLTLNGIKGKNGGTWASMQVRRVLTNPIYVKSNEDTSEYLIQLGINVFGKPNGNGYLTYNKTKNIVQDRNITDWIAAVGAHLGVIEPDTWIYIQQLLKNSNIKKPRLGTGDSPALLVGILRCDKCGSDMVVKQGHNSKTNTSIRYDYYVCSSKIYNTPSKLKFKCNNKNVRVDKLDSIVVSNLQLFDANYLIDEISKHLCGNNNNKLYNLEIENIEEKIKVKQNSIENLLNQLSDKQYENISKYLIQQIEKIDKEIKLMNSEVIHLKSLQNNKLKTEDDNTFLKNLIKTMQIDYSFIKDVTDKRNLLKTVIEYITWNGDLNRYKIKFKENNKKR
jgi:site-specific DNA recombinase